VLTPDESILYLAVTRANAVWRVPLASPGGLHVGRLGLGRVGVWVQMSGGIGPDGIAMDVEGRVAVAHPGMGAVRVFDRQGEPVRRVRCCDGLRRLRRARAPPPLDVPGLPLASHQD
jgi:gluconolactonase